ncbi:MAG: hypothetical protein LUQ56_05120 [Methylococcaceae bacterium]|jgi:hypothetical protein|nr:hypothetical protein [Methylococcaceae bacterium]MDD1633530.1 hypothetical protein [Methylococcaceae bacterium]MDD1637502.1 hypothetical protein [Methylococcaceae bacterium]MDD1644377.1 hypothetical protein [Methylococcaceae bacterium]OYV19337.1 MAG: putative integron protein cassette protein [Methylococcaceae bacterium NSM2-1]
MNSQPTTAYFRNDILIKRPYIQLEWCQATLLSPVRREIQPDGRIRHWVFVPELDKYLRVVTLSDGITLHNDFLTGDLNYEAKLR